MNAISKRHRSAVGAVVVQRRSKGAPSTDARVGRSYSSTADAFEFKSRPRLLPRERALDGDIQALMTPATIGDLRDYMRAMLTAFRVPHEIIDPHGFMKIQCAMLMRRKFPAVVLVMAFEEALEQEDELPSTATMIERCEFLLREETDLLRTEWQFHRDDECPL
jgi:hypothetical protein